MVPRQGTQVKKIIFEPYLGGRFYIVKSAAFAYMGHW